MEELRKKLVEQAQLREDWAKARDAANKAAVDFISAEPDPDKRKEIFDYLYATLDNGQEVDEVVTWHMMKNDYIIK